MGNLCCVCRQLDEDDEATNALLDSLEQFNIHQSSSGRPRGPPPPYQARAPFYAMTDEQRAQWVQRVTMIQCLPLGKYCAAGEDKKDKDLKLEPSDEVQGTEKKGDVDRECPICMVDFMPDEPIRLLPCMHYYHMRCIDDWLMRSYSCPTCMERIDVGMQDTISSTTTGSSRHPSLRRRRNRRRRGERGSSSSAHSISSQGSAQAAAIDGCSKRESISRRFLIPDSCEEELTASASAGGNEVDIPDHGRGRKAKGSEEKMAELEEEVFMSHHDTVSSSHSSRFTSGSHASADLLEQHGGITVVRSSPQPDYLTGDEGNMSGMSGNACSMNITPQSTPASIPPLDVNQIMRISNFEVDPQDMGPFSPPLSPHLPQATPLSPPMFEYHFDYPVAGDLSQQM